MRSCHHRQYVDVPTTSRSFHELSRPVARGAVSGLRAFLFLAVVAFVLSLGTWLVAVSQMLPFSVVPTWAMHGFLAAVGFPFEQTGFAITLPPSLMSVVVAWTMFRAAKRVRAEDTIASSELVKTQLLRLLGVSGTALVAVAVLVVISGVSITGLAVARCLALLVAAPAWGMRVGSEHLARWCDDRLSIAWGDAIDSSARLVRLMLVTLVVVANLVFVVALVVNFSAGAEVVAAYSSPVAAAIGLGAIQVLFAPTVWASVLTWISGLPLHLGGTATASASAGFEGVLPAIPSMALVPHSPHPAAIALVAVPIVALALVIAFSADATVANTVVAGIHAFVVLAVSSLFFFGSIGPGGLQQTGVAPWAFIVGSAVWLAVGTSVGLGMRKLRDFYVESSSPERH